MRNLSLGYRTKLTLLRNSLYLNLTPQLSNITFKEREPRIHKPSGHDIKAAINGNNNDVRVCNGGRITTR